MQLLDAARVRSKEDMGFPKRGGRGQEAKCWFMRALASRAVDLAVIQRTKNSGLADEPAGAVFIAGFPGAKPVAEHVTAFLKQHQEWVFGDYKGELPNFSYSRITTVATLLRITLVITMGRTRHIRSGCSDS